MSESMESVEPKRQIYLLDEDECPPCDVLKEALKEQIDSGKVKVLKVTSDEALQLLERAGAGDKIEFPSALVEDEKGVRHCQIYHSKDITLSKCGDEIIAIREPEEEKEDVTSPPQSPGSPSA